MLTKCLKCKERMLNYLFVDRYIYFAILNFHLNKKNKEKMDACIGISVLLSPMICFINTCFLFELLLLLQVLKFGGGDGFRKSSEHHKTFIGRNLWITFKRCHIGRITLHLQYKTTVMSYLWTGPNRPTALKLYTTKDPYKSSHCPVYPTTQILTS